MRFLKLLLLLLLVTAGGVFSYRNWSPVTVELWGGMVLDTYLPLLLIVSFLVGLIPYFLMHRATRWSLRRKLESVERSLSELRTPPAAPVVPVALDSGDKGALPPVAAPIAVPPGVS